MNTDIVTKSYKGLVKHYDQFDEDVKKFLGKLEWLLVDGRDLDLVLSYSFRKIEEGQHRALKCGLVRLHACHSEKVDEALLKQHFTISSYETIFRHVFGNKIPQDILAHKAEAQKTRNKLLHGKNVPEKELREAVSHSFVYMNQLGSYVRKKTSMNPFGNLKGLRGRKKTLEKRTTHWVLKGMGFGESSVPTDSVDT